MSEDSDISSPHRSHISSSSPGTQPIATSTPNPKNKRHPPKANKKLKECERLCVLNINCRSIKNKIPDLQQVISQVKPDIICCTETWLKPEISTAEIFPDFLNFQVYRDDRLEGKGGGTLVAISKSILSQEQPDPKSKYNSVWAKMSLKGFKDIYISSFYKPNEKDEIPLNELWSSIKKIPKNSIVWVLGDFNMSSIDWSTESLTEGCKFPNIYTSFLENLINLNLQQMVNIPTRGNNVLDLFLTNMPSHVHSTKTLPPLGSSDHDIVFHEIKINRGRPLQTKREIQCYNKANWNCLKNDVSKYAKVYSETHYTDPNKAWISFKDELNHLCSIHIPTKVTKTRRDLPCNKTESCGVAPLKSEGQTFTDPVAKADILNSQFESVFSRPQPLSLSQACKQKHHPSMPEVSISEDGVKKLLKDLNPNKASGPDQISPRLLKELHREVTPILTHIFQISLKTGIVPEDWKHAISCLSFQKRLILMQTQQLYIDQSPSHA
ncbi:uncharacterized protein LOC132737744 [Ruditapes philippinarum]|uniref:uncharacterized protein LOC132737744 n=1 Tax=Ruditapes philippinarum TaxID=129788 RepID=UPI00295BF1F4|nr:uncharacterized protein LOC132737744 [Ruditapes philippinarum]